MVACLTQYLCKATDKILTNHELFVFICHENELSFKNDLNNFEKLSHDINEGLNNDNLGKKVSKKGFDTSEKNNCILTSAANNFSWPINSINKTNNKSNIGNKVLAFSLLINCW